MKHTAGLLIQLFPRLAKIMPNQRDSVSSKKMENSLVPTFLSAVPCFLAFLWSSVLAP
jgi:hypothetical protein